MQAASGLVLFVSAVVALGLANSPLSTGYFTFWETPLGLNFGRFDFTRSLQHWINDGLMTLFFFVVALELKRELVLGEMRSLSRAALPLFAAAGGIAAPIGLYLLMMVGRDGAHGWGVVMATDTAFVVGCLALFGSRIPASLRLFLLSLAIFDDVGAILAVTFAYSDAPNWSAFALGVLILVIIAGCARLGIRSLPIYFMLGAAVWLCIDASGIHATITGVILGLMTPTRVWVSDARLRGILARLLAHPQGGDPTEGPEERRDLRRAKTAVAEALSPVERLEVALHPWAAFLIMPLFALANAGVELSLAAAVQPVALATAAALALGKPAGVVGASWLAIRCGWASRGSELSWAHLMSGALLTGIGFTMSLFIAGIAYPPDILDQAKIGILVGSICAASSGLLLLSWLTSRRQAG